MPVFPKLTYKYNAIPIRITADFFFSSLTCGLQNSFESLNKQEQPEKPWKKRSRREASLLGD